MPRQYLLTLLQLFVAVMVQQDKTILLVQLCAIWLLAVITVMLTYTQRLMLLTMMVAVMPIQCTALQLAKV
jgi:hypothetical protein